MLNTKLFDHTILKADATEAQVAKICDEALAHDFASVCVNQYYTKFVAEKLKGSDVKVCTVVGFPLGMSDTRVKAFETRAAIEDGAQEVDMVINVGALKDGKYDFVRSDIQTLKEVCGKDIVLKVIIETCLLTDEEKVKACELAKEAGADFVKTSTGFSTGGAKAADVALMRKTVGPDMGVKASGGIHNADEAQAMVDAGASRLGTSATLADKLVESFGRDEVSILRHDNYYKRHDDIPFEERAKLNYDHPDAFDTDLLCQHILELKAGKSIEMPVYDYAMHNRSDKTILVHPAPVIVLEGILLFVEKDLCDLMDIKVFVDTDADVRILRRILRDVKERGRSLDSVVTQYLTTVKPMHEQFVEPSKRRADVIIPEGGQNTVALEMLIERVRKHLNLVQNQ